MYTGFLLYEKYGGEDSALMNTFISTIASVFS